MNINKQLKLKTLLSLILILPLILLTSCKTTRLSSTETIITYLKHDITKKNNIYFGINFTDEFQDEKDLLVKNFKEIQPFVKRAHAIRGNLKVSDNFDMEAPFMKNISISEVVIDAQIPKMGIPYMAKQMGFKKRKQLDNNQNKISVYYSENTKRYLTPLEKDVIVITEESPALTIPRYKNAKLLKSYIVEELFYTQNFAFLDFGTFDFSKLAPGIRVPNISLYIILNHTNNTVNSITITNSNNQDNTQAQEETKSDSMSFEIHLKPENKKFIRIISAVSKPLIKAVFEKEGIDFKKSKFEVIDEEIKITGQIDNFFQRYSKTFMNFKSLSVE